MEQVLCPRKFQFSKHIKEHPEVILLLAADDVDQPIKVPVLLPLNSGSDILGQVEGCSVAAKKDLLVEADLLQIDPDRPILLLIEGAGGETFEDFVLPEAIGLTLVVDLVEADARGTVGSLRCRR